MQIITEASLLNSYRDLLVAWVIRTVRARYQQSILGSLWAIVQPAASVAIFSIIFTRFVPVDTGGIPYIVFSYTAMVPWTFFASAITDMVDSLVSNMNLVSKIYFPREILPLSALLARLIDFGIAGVVLILLLFAYGRAISLSALLFLPAILGTELALALGLGLIGAAVNVFYRDIRHLLTLGLQIWLYATPIIYPLTAVPEQLRFFYLLNPMAGILEAYRAVLLYNATPGRAFGFAVVVSFFTLVAGYWFFKKVEDQFADVI